MTQHYLAVDSGQLAIVAFYGCTPTKELESGFGFRAITDKAIVAVHKRRECIDIATVENGQFSDALPSAGRGEVWLCDPCYILEEEQYEQLLGHLNVASDSSWNCKEWHQRRQRYTITNPDGSRVELYNFSTTYGDGQYDLHVSSSSAGVFESATMMLEDEQEEEEDDWYDYDLYEGDDNDLL